MTKVGHILCNEHLNIILQLLHNTRKERPFVALNVRLFMKRMSLFNFEIFGGAFIHSSTSHLMFETKHQNTRVKKKKKVQLINLARASECIPRSLL